MSYFEVLALFIGPPLLVLALLAWRDGRSKPVAAWGVLAGRAYWAVLLHVAIAVAYTTPWDNYLVATGVWWYDPALVTGITVGWVPIEEYTFFVVQTLMSGLLLLALMRYAFKRSGVLKPSLRLRWGASVAAGIVWLAGVMLLVSGWDKGTYLGLILGWATIPIVTQLAFGADILWARRRLVAVGIALPSVYLWIADAVAIQSGTWTIDPAQSTGVLLAGILPVEEAVFFTVTNLLVVFGMVLMLAPESQTRTRDLLAKLRRREMQQPRTWTQQHDEI
ncbi:MAG TPA: lycopene cyclase domain-containing protein [Aggregatilinea sp.]|uniref:lycopene cyclase domain-containing protein n=1 Tax=Aggregatilinea sp. TaxID=2806333 RepID=UPI002C62168F|nr:lycopene cyclase domain-containing protein [Aggregatilinea sp.]HML21215.1 lycopene cyclase domain-containing protein [Aggregatilinea sp.]